ncbi:MAG: phospholipid/cholesterol/gamma-HCH transport system substrate-binding protein, partial [Thermoleophilaceae bacterium]|nr:phospholipid/cholesterol/gamma-HCH transport system substrate-binding protein [Thermoleophilaceae bacterium]
RRGAGASIAANPVLIGAATTLVIIVAVFLAYNANNGLPFVPTYQLTVEVPNAANLVRGNDVRIAGSRVGVVDKIGTKVLNNGQVIAVLDLKLETTVEKLPKDSSVLVRPRSALGLKYVQITLGKSKQGFDNGSTVPLTAAKPQPVEIDEVFNMFDAKTRAAQQKNLYEFGNALAGRGSSLNTFIGDLNPLLSVLTPVLQNLSNTRTQLGRLFPALERVASAVAPVAETQASLFRNLDTTFIALNNVARPFIQETIQLAPPSLAEGIRDFPQQRVFLANSTLLFRELLPGVKALRAAIPDLSAALVAGTPALARSPSFNKGVADVFVTLRDFALDPIPTIGLKTLTNTVTTLQPTLDFLRPVQTNCNYISLFARNAASLLSEGDKNGTWQRFIIIATPQGPNNEGGPSSAPANGGGPDPKANFLHTNPYPNVGATGQPNECEAGNETYVAGQQVIGNPPGNQGTNTEKTTANLTQR